MEDIKSLNEDSSTSNVEVDKDIATVESSVNYTDEINLRNLGTIIMIVGSIAGAILFVTLSFVVSKREYLKDEISFSFTGLVIAILTVLGSIAVGYLFYVLSNISISLKKLK